MNNKLMFEAWRFLLPKFGMKYTAEIKIVRESSRVKMTRATRDRHASCLKRLIETDIDIPRLLQPSAPTLAIKQFHHVFSMCSCNLLVWKESCDLD